MRPEIPIISVVVGSLTLLDWFATFAPEPTESEINLERSYDLNRERNNDSYVAREDSQIVCELRYKHAMAMIMVRNVVYGRK